MQLIKSNTDSSYRETLAKQLLSAELLPGLTVEAATHGNTRFILDPYPIPDVGVRAEDRAALLRAGLRYVDPGEGHWPFIELACEQRFRVAFPGIAAELLPLLRRIVGIRPYAAHLPSVIHESVKARPALSVVR